MAEEQKILTKSQIIKNLIKQNTEAILLGEIMLDYESSNPWKHGDVKKKAEQKIRVEKIRMKEKENKEFLDFLKRYLEKIGDE